MSWPVLAMPDTSPFWVPDEAGTRTSHTSSSSYYCCCRYCSWVVLPRSWSCQPAGAIGHSFLEVVAVLVQRHQRLHKITLHCWGMNIYLGPQQDYLSFLDKKNASLVSLNLVYSSWWSNPNTRREANFIEFLLFKLSVCISLPTQDCKNPLLHFLLVDFRLICFVWVYDPL